MKMFTILIYQKKIIFPYQCNCQTKNIIQNQSLSECFINKPNDNIIGIMITEVKTHELRYGAYTSMVAEGRRIRRMMRTQLSLEKIVMDPTKRARLTESANNQPYYLEKMIKRKSLPKVETIRSKNKKGKEFVRKIIEIRYEYYDKNVSLSNHNSIPLNSQKQQTLARKVLQRENTGKQSNYSKILISKSHSASQHKYSSKMSSHSHSRRQRFLNQTSINKKKIDTILVQSHKNEHAGALNIKMRSSAHPLQFQANEYQFNYDVKGIKTDKRKKDKILDAAQGDSSKIKNDSYKSLKKNSLKSNVIIRKDEKIDTSKSLKQNNSSLNNSHKKNATKRNSQTPFVIEEIDHISGRSSVQSLAKLHEFNKVLQNMSFEERYKNEGSQKVEYTDKKSPIKNDLAESAVGLGLSLKLDSIRNDNFYHSPGVETSRSRERGNSFKNLPLTSRQPSVRRSLIGNSMDQPCTNNIEDVYERVEIYNYLLGLIAEYSQITKTDREGQQQYYQVLCFLLERKYFDQKVNLLKTLTSKKAKNVFTPVPVQISTQILHQYIDHQNIKQFAKELQEFRISQKKNLDKQAQQLLQRHNKTEQKKFLAMDNNAENYSIEIIKRLKAEMERLYEEWQEAKQDSDEEQQARCEQRMIETMELVFFLSELKGKRVKKLQFSEQIADFEEYYEKYLPKLMETYAFYEKNEKN